MTHRSHLIRKFEWNASENQLIKVNKLPSLTEMMTEIKKKKQNKECFNIQTRVGMTKTVDGWSPGWGSLTVHSLTPHPEDKQYIWRHAGWLAMHLNPDSLSSHHKRTVSTSQRCAESLAII